MTDIAQYIGGASGEADTGQGTGAGTGGSTGAPGDQAVSVAVNQLGKPYISGKKGPDSFDCSGLVYYCYLNINPPINIQGDTQSQWHNQTTMTTVWDQVQKMQDYQTQASAGQPPQIQESDLELGDCIYYFQDGSSLSNQHVKMYAGGGMTIEAPAPGGHVQQSNLDLHGQGNEPFRGVKRVKGGGSAGGGGSNSGQGSGNGGTPNQTSAQTLATVASQLQNAKDPPNNLPFSAAFQGQIVPSTASTGSLIVPAFGPAPTLAPATKLVRGGIGELLAKKFKCYFMMNPAQISVSVDISTSVLSPLLQNPDVYQSSGYPISNQTLSFTLYFNRMYEVWRGNVHGPNGGPGPSDEGVRWDTRSLERLMGVLDADDSGAATGLGTNGWGMAQAQMLPLQIAFGGQKSIRFQGWITNFDYYFTLFSADMIPIEAYAEIQVMRVYNTAYSGADLLGMDQSLVTTTGLSGPQNFTAGSQINQPFTT